MPDIYKYIDDILTPFWNVSTFCRKKKEKKSYFGFCLYSISGLFVVQGMGNQLPVMDLQSTFFLPLVHILPHFSGVLLDNVQLHINFDP